MKRVVIFCILLISFSCNKKSEKESSVKYFEFSYDNSFETSFTLIYKPNDSIYLREHWSFNDIYDSVKSPKSKTNYSAKISAEKEEELLKLISSINFKSLKNEYFEDYSDGNTYAVFIEKDSINKLITIHSHNAPKELYSLAHWIYELKKKLILVETKKKLNIISAKYVLPPPPPPAPIMKNKNGI